MVKLNERTLSDMAKAIKERLSNIVTLPGIVETSTHLPLPTKILN